MYYVYILKSEKDGGLYIGKTNNLQRRISEHNSGHTPSLKNRIPLRLLEYTECENEFQARILEREYKKGCRREKIKRKYNLERC